MEKKIRVTLPNYIYETLLKDIETFSINKNKICNYIFENTDCTFLKDKIRKSKDSKTLQFNLNKKNLSNYYAILEENNVHVEAEFFRKIFYTYISKPQNERESFIFKGHLLKIIDIIENSKTCKITFIDGRSTKITPYYIGSSDLKLANYLFCYDHHIDDYKNYKICYIKSIFTLREEGFKGDLDFIRDVKENFDPFLSKGKIIEVLFTPKGEEMFSELKMNRPKVIKNIGLSYTLECSNEKAKRYFSYFLSEVKVLSPKSLSNWFKEEFYKAYNNYL